MLPVLPAGLQVLILLAIFSSLKDLLRRLMSVGRRISVGDETKSKMVVICLVLKP